MWTRALAVLVAVLLFTGGCASIFSAVQKTPQRLDDVLNDPVRKSHLVTEILLSTASMAASIGCSVTLPLLVGIIPCALGGLLVYFVGYEFILEPISKDRVQEGKPSLVGPYWERGPQDGEVFVRP